MGFASEWAFVPVFVPIAVRPALFLPALGRLCDLVLYIDRHGQHEKSAHSSSEGTLNLHRRR